MLVYSSRVSSPAVFGPLRPVLILPEEYRSRPDDPALRYILMHELAHVKRGDLAVHTLLMVLQAIYWFNPLLWLARRRMQTLRELCCDATVAGILKEETPAYREILLQTARRLLATPDKYGMGLLGLVEQTGSLMTRLRWLEKKLWRHPHLRIITIVLTVFLVLLTIFPMACFESQLKSAIETKNLAVTIPKPGLPIIVDASRGQPMARFDGEEIELAGILTPQDGDWRPDGSPLDLNLLKLSGQDLSTIAKWRLDGAGGQIALLFLSNHPIPTGAPSALELITKQGSPLVPEDTLHLQQTRTWKRRWPTLRIMKKVGPAPASLDLQIRMAYDAMLPEQLAIDPRASGRKYVFNGNSLAATVQNLPSHFSGNWMNPEERPQIFLAFQDGVLLPGFDVRVRLKDGRMLPPSDWPEKNKPSGTWGFGWPVPISLDNVDRFVYCGRRVQPILWQAIRLVRSATRRQTLAERIIHFPSGSSVGELYIREEGPAHEESHYNLINWQKLGEASGPVTVPQGKAVLLKIRYGITDLSFLDLLHLDDLQELSFSSSANSYLPEKQEKILLDQSELFHLRGLSGLQLLNLSLINATNQSLKSLSKLQSLEVLYLTGPGITDEGLKALTGLRALRQLFLDTVSETGIDTQRNGRLRAIYGSKIANHMITDTGLTILSHCQSLEQLMVAGTGITDAGLSSLKRLPKLWELDISNTHVSDAGMKDLKAMVSLKYLNLDRTGITDAGLAEIAQMSWLERLVARFNPGITDASLENLKKLNYLNLLNLSQTAVTDKGMARIKPELKATCILLP